MKFSSNDKVDQLRLVRWKLRRSIARVQFGQSALQNSPIIFGNSFPKSGSHLLAQILLAFPKIGLAVDRGMGPILTYERETGRKRSTAEIMFDLRQLGPGDVGFGHIISNPEIQHYWNNKRIAHYFILRDPRDVVVSHAYYIGDKATQNVHYEYYKQLPIEERIQVSIVGRPDWEGDFPNIHSRFAQYADWLDCPWVQVLHFEDLISSRNETLERIIDYACERGFQLKIQKAEAMEILSNAIDPKQSFTFRRGQIGDWQNLFTEEHKKLFKEIGGELLVSLGYEQDRGW